MEKITHLKSLKAGDDTLYYPCLIRLSQGANGKLLAVKVQAQGHGGNKDYGISDAVTLTCKSYTDRKKILNAFIGLDFSVNSMSGGDTKYAKCQVCVVNAHWVKFQVPCSVAVKNTDYGFTFKVKFPALANFIKVNMTYE